MRSARLAAVALALVILVPAIARAAYSPASANGWFPIAGRGPGPSNAQNRTDLWLFNPDAAVNATVTLTFHPSAASGAPAGTAVNSAPIVLFPRETKFFPDVTSVTVPVGDAFGALEWNSNVPVMASVHKYLSSVTGTSGGVYGGTPGTEALGARASATDSVNVLQLFGLHSGDANFSTQLDVANTSPVALPIEVRVVQSPSNSILATTSYTVAPKSLLRAGNPFQGLSLDDTLRVTVAVREGTSIPSGGVIASATVTDLRSNDGNVVLGQRQGSGTRLRPLHARREQPLPEQRPLQGDGDVLERAGLGHGHRDSGNERHGSVLVLQLAERRDGRQGLERLRLQPALLGVRGRPDERAGHADGHRHGKQHGEDLYEPAEHRLPADPGHGCVRDAPEESSAVGGRLLFGTGS